MRVEGTEMRILISGASGFIGTALRPALSAAGHATTALVRHSPSLDASEVQWNPRQPLDPRVLQGFDALIHLAGKNVSGRWTEKFKREVRESRVQGTKTLAVAAAESFWEAGRPRVMVAASAIGYYGDRGDEELSESSSRGSGFLADVCQEWEGAAAPARDAGIRVVHIRIGVVLAKQGGALKAMLTPFQLGLGGPVGNGKQFWSWIALDDVVSAFVFALGNEALSGPVNAVAPHPARNTEFTRELGKALHRPAIVPVPAFVVRTIFGEMGQSLLLASARVMPAKLQAAGFRFQHPDLSEALQAVLGHSR
jgi:uncharacterized protein (TIGR01777 family)